jgi:hypothetical protein
MSTAVMPQQPARAWLEAIAYAYLPQRYRDRHKETFFGVIQFVPLAASSAGATSSLDIGTDADFVCLGATRVITLVDNTTFRTAAPLTAQIRDLGSNRDLSNLAAHVDNVFGTGQLPALWPVPKIFQAGGGISLTLANLEAVAFNVRCVFLGFKVYPFPAR